MINNIWFNFNFRYGIYPLTAFTAKQPPPPRPRAISPEISESVKSVTPEPLDIETRRVVNMMCNVKPKEETGEFMVGKNIIKIIYSLNDHYFILKL